MDKEAATIISLITGALTAILGVLVAFGLDFSDTQRNAILGAVAPMVLVIIAVGPVIRQFVWSRHSVQKAVSESYVAGASGLQKPTV